MNLMPRLEQLEKRHEELSHLLGQPEATNDMDQFTKFNKEYSDLTPIVEAFGAYKGLLSEKSDLEAMLSDKETDADMKEMAQEEYNAVLKAIPESEEKLKIHLIPKDADDDRNVIIEVRAGAGGDEAALFAGDIFRMYVRFAEVHGWKTEILEESANETGGYKEVVAQINGAGVYAKMKFESGVHRVQRVPETESQGRIHTSAITVAVLPEAEEADVNIEAKDLRTDTYRASGSGGQHVNTTDSAVRITHLPTGIVAQCQDQSSQHKNRDSAMKMLIARVHDAERERLDQARSADRKSQVGSGDRSERIRTYNFPQSRVTDHRINLTKHNLDEILSGEGLTEVVESLTTEDQARKLASMAEDAA